MEFQDDDIGPLVPDVTVAKDLGITLRALKNWATSDKTFPPLICINGRCFRRLRALIEYKHELIRRTVEAGPNKQPERLAKHGGRAA